LAAPSWISPRKVSILDLMDCRVKTIQYRYFAYPRYDVSILDLMDCRVKTVIALLADATREGFNPWFNGL